MKYFTLPSVAMFLKIFRIAVSLLLMIHGLTRILRDTVDEFGDFLDEQGFPVGIFAAWAITFFEVIGSLLMMSGYFVSWISLLFVVELAVGIILVHPANEWFIVGGVNGMEYSILLIECFLLIAATDPILRSRASMR